MAGGRLPRILGVSVEDVTGWDDVDNATRRSQFFKALAERFDLVGVVQAEVTRPQYYRNAIRTFHPRLRRWEARFDFSEFVLRKRTEAVQRGLDKYCGSYDVLLQVQTLCMPGLGPLEERYVIYTDNTMALTQRYYPAWAGLSRKRAAEWMAVEQELCHRADAVFTFSNFARRSVIEDYSCAQDKVIAIGAGANQLAERLHEKESVVPRALFVGMDFERKGGPLLLEAWRQVRERLSDAELVIAGPRRDPRRGCPGVTWAGRVDRRALAGLYGRASVFVMPSLFEPWGHVFLEAMGHGLPCVGTWCCAMPEIIEDGVTGRLVAPGEVEPLAGALIEMLGEPEKAAAWGKAGYSSVVRRGRWSNVVERAAPHLFGEGGAAGQSEGSAVSGAWRDGGAS